MAFELPEPQAGPCLPNPSISRQPIEPRVCSRAFSKGSRVAAALLGDGAIHLQPSRKPFHGSLPPPLPIQPASVSFQSLLRDLEVSHETELAVLHASISELQARLNLADVGNQYLYPPVPILHDHGQPVEPHHKLDRVVYVQPPPTPKAQFRGSTGGDSSAIVAQTMPEQALSGVDNGDFDEETFAVVPCIPVGCEASHVEHCPQSKPAEEVIDIFPLEPGRGIMAAADVTEKRHPSYSPTVCSSLDQENKARNTKRSTRISVAERMSQAHVSEGRLQRLRKGAEVLKNTAAEKGGRLRKRTGPRRTSEVISNMKEDEDRMGHGQRSVGVRDLCRFIVCHGLFDPLCAGMIMVNATVIGISVQSTTDWTKEPPEIGWLETAGHVCNAFFFMELVLRVLALGLRPYFCCEDKAWNIFDFVLVAMSLIDVAILLQGAGSSADWTAQLKILKMLRVVRIFRAFRFFRDLSLMALMIFDSLKSLFWALVLLMIIVYVFAICFTQGAELHLREFMENPTPNYDSIAEYFGNLPKTVYILLQAMLGGVSWGEVTNALKDMPWIFFALFFFYLSFTILAVLNIITGVFVDNAVETAKTQREFLVQKEMELREAYTKEMRQFFMEMDSDGSGSITMAELMEYFDDKRVQSYFQALGLDPEDTERLFELIDEDGSGEVSIDEFLQGCLRLKGLARSIDVHAVLTCCKSLQRHLDPIGHAKMQEQAQTNAALVAGKKNPS